MHDPTPLQPTLQPVLTPEEVTQAAQRLLESFQAWQRGERGREAFTAEVLTVPPTRGSVVRDLLARLRGLPQAQPPTTPPDREENTAAWRDELMSSRARTWSYPEGAGLLVGPSVLILTDGRAGVALHEGGYVRALPMNLSASLMLLSETIVMAQNALSAREVEQLQRQRIDATSSSLSAIDPIR